MKSSLRPTKNQQVIVGFHCKTQIENVFDPFPEYLFIYVYFCPRPIIIIKVSWKGGSTNFVKRFMFVPMTLEGPLPPFLVSEINIYSEGSLRDAFSFHSTILLKYRWDFYRNCLLGRILFGLKHVSLTTIICVNND